MASNRQKLPYSDDQFEVYDYSFRGSYKDDEPAGSLKRPGWWQLSD